MKARLFSRFKLAQLEKQLQATHTECVRKYSGLQSGPSTPEDRERLEQESINASISLEQFSLLSAVVKTVDEGTDPLMSFEDFTDALNEGREPLLQEFLHNTRVGFYAAETLDGMPQEAYLNIGQGPFHSNCNFSVALLWEGERGSIGLRRRLLLPDLHLYAVKQSEKWKNSHVAREKVATALLGQYTMRYGFSMRGFPIQLPDTHSLASKNIVEWTISKVVFIFEQMGLMKMGSISTDDSLEQLRLVVQVASCLMLPHWWDMGVDDIKRTTARTHWQQF